MQNSFSYERFRTLTGFETEAQENSEMAYYRSVISGNGGSGLSEKFQKLQNLAARILMCANYDSNIDPWFRVPCGLA